MRVILQKIVRFLPFCLAILFITPLVNAAQNSNKIPQRIIVLDWDLLEQILTLDVIPVGATEIAGYNQLLLQILLKKWVCEQSLI